MAVHIASDCDLIDVPDWASGCAANEERIRIVIFKRETTVVRDNARHQAKVD
jgi:hypothetical protein